MIQNADKILFRCSGYGNLMTEPKGKTNLEKYNDAVAAKTEAELKYNVMKKEDKAGNIMKSAINAAAKIEKLKAEVERLELIKDKKELSETCKAYLLEVYALEVHGRRNEISSKYLDKGNNREQTATTLISLVTNTFFQQNTERQRDEYKQGELDLYLGESIYNAEETLDTKCSWSLKTFLEAMFDDVNDNYFYQGQGYMSLSGAKRHTIAYCLVNATLEIINDELFKLQRKMGIIDAAMAPDKYFEKAKQIERNHIFDIKEFMKEYPHYDILNEYDVEYTNEGPVYSWEFDIQMEKRLFRFTFKRDDEVIEKMNQRAIECRNYMNNTFFNNLKFEREL